MIPLLIKRTWIKKSRFLAIIGLFMSEKAGAYYDLSNLHRSQAEVFRQYDLTKRGSGV